MLDRTTLLYSVLSYAARGWHVFPLWPGSKTPAVAEAWQRRATTDTAMIERWWSARPYNIGIATGPSGLVVIDLDPSKIAPIGRWRPVRSAATAATAATAQVNPVASAATVASGSATAATTTHPLHGRDVFAHLCARHREPIPADTYTVATAGGGWHLYYRHPTGGPQLRNTKGGSERALGELIDTRAHGGYVVAAGSHVSGRNYGVVRDAEVTPLPGWLADLLGVLDTAARPAPGAPVRVPMTASDRRSAYLRAAVNRELAHIANAPAGKGNAVLWGAAVALGQLVAGGDLDAALIADVLEQAAIARGRSPIEARATIASGLRRGAQRPRTVAP